MKNILINLIAQAAFAKLILWLANYMPALGVYAELPYVEQAFVAFWFTLAFFIFIIWVKENYVPDIKQATGWQKGIAYAFVLVDVYFNVTFSPLLLQQFANSYDEGWTFTSHCRAIKRYSEAKIASGKRLNPVEWLRYWLCENLYGKVLNLGEPGHYSEERQR